MDCTGIVKVFDNQDRIVWRYIEGSDWDYYYAEEATCGTYWKWRVTNELETCLFEKSN